MTTSLSDYDAYRNICLRASENDATFTTFKQNEEYRKILEHVTKPQALMYLDRVVKLGKLTPGDIEKAKENDQQGSPTQETYVAPFGLISPSTIRYMSVLSEIMAHIGDLNGFTIVEVGGGYGGQCKLIKDKFDIKEYHIYDLPEPLALMQKYHKKYDYKNIVYHDVKKEIDPIPSIDLFISNYAFSEIKREIQEVYLTHFIDKARHIHMVCNWNGESISRTELLTRLPNAKMEVDDSPWTETFFW